MINAPYFVDPKALMPVPQLTLHNGRYGYWKNWYAFGHYYSLDIVDHLLQTIQPGSLILFDDRFCNQRQYAILRNYDSGSHVAYFQLLNDQLQPINATASLTWDDNSKQWSMSIQSACLYLRSYVDECPNDELMLNSCEIQDGVLGAYTRPVK